MGRSLSNRTTNTSHGSGVLSARSVGIKVPSRLGLASGDRDPPDLPPAFSALDMARTPLQLPWVNRDPGIGGCQDRKLGFFFYGSVRETRMQLCYLVLIPLTSKHSLLRPLLFFFFCSVLYTVFITYPSSVRGSREDRFEIY